MSHISMELPHALYTAAQVRELDRLAIQDANIPAFELMRRAAAAAFQLLKDIWPAAKKITVLCGSGNNAGDAYLLAAMAHEEDFDVTLVQAGDESKFSAEGKLAADKCRQLGLLTHAFDSALISEADLVVDGLLGSGLDRDLDQRWTDMVLAVNRHATAVLALDLPSGLHADKACAMSVAVMADATLTFIGLKQGLLTGQGPKYCGNLYFSDLGVPQKIYQQIRPSLYRIELDSFSHLLGARARDTHKGDCGHVLLIGGDYGYAGAIRLAAEAALRVGAGLVTVATRPQHALTLSISRPEIMTVAVESAADIRNILKRVNTVVIGPGLGQSAWASELLSSVMQRKELPLVVDADALNLLAAEPTQSSNWVLTPHPGEAARLLGIDSGEVQSNRFAALVNLQNKYGGVCMLKGAGSLIAAADGELFLSDAGNPGMASGGMGDVLSGVIGGLLAQGLAADEACCLGVCLHARAADYAADSGERGMLASDLLPELRRLVNPDQ